MQNRIFITGISGLLGVSLATRFLNEGFEVVGSKQKNTPLPDSLKGLEIYEGDINDYDFFHECLREKDVVFHCAALVSFDRKEAEKLSEINIKGTETILQASADKRISKFVLISSIAALGRPANDQLITEKTLWEESEYNTNYAKSKFASEVEFWRVFEEGLDGFVVNPSVILGRGDLYSSSNRLFQNLFKKNAFVVDGAINVVDIRDLTEIIYQLFKKEISGKKFIVSGHKTSIEGLMSAIAIRSNKKVNVVKVPLWVAKIFRPLENFIAFITGKKAQITKETLKVLEAESSYDNSLINKELGFEYLSLESSLDWCCSYYVDKYASSQK